jgi:uncharacterized FlaG/YvyC family protein
MKVTPANGAIHTPAAAAPARERAAEVKVPHEPAPAPQGPAPMGQAPSPAPEQTQLKIAEQVQRYLQSSTRNLEFQVEGESGTAVIVVRDASGEVIRRIPGEEALQLMRRLNAQSGTLVDSIA